jgi:hypothetical protein
LPNRIIATSKVPDGDTRHRSGLLLQRRTRDRALFPDGLSQRQHVARRGDCCIQQFCLWCHDCNATDAARTLGRSSESLEAGAADVAAVPRVALDTPPTPPIPRLTMADRKGRAHARRSSESLQRSQGTGESRLPAEERAAPRLQRVGDNVLREGNIGLVRAQHLGEIGM